MHAKYFAVGVAIAIFAFVIELIRREKMTFRYSLFWLSACLIILPLAIWDNLLRKLSILAGFELVSNFVFFLLLAFFTGLSLLLTLYINEQNEKSRQLAQSIARLEYRIQELESKKG